MDLVKHEFIEISILMALLRESQFHVAMPEKSLN
jgi:hypothetical protein